MSEQNVGGKQNESQKCRVVSIRIKIIALIVSSVLLICSFAIIISFYMFKNNTIKEYTKVANSITKLSSEFIDPDKVEEYIVGGESIAGYLDTKEMLMHIYESNDDIEYLYVYKIMDDGCHVVFDMDAPGVEGSKPGEIISFDESFQKYVPYLIAGKEIPAIISNDTYGWLLTVYKPIYDSNGICKCYTAVDISMSNLSNYYYSYLKKFVTIMGIVFVIILVVTLLLIESNIIRPINAIANTSGNYANNAKPSETLCDTGEIRLLENLVALKKLDIRTGDEVENLYKAILKTTKANVFFVKEIKNEKNTVLKMQSSLIGVIADMIESKDEYTGNHIRKTAAYVAIIADEMRKQGFYKEEMTQDFIENIIFAAPLHDIGKIHIPDCILSKNSNLTDEEYSIMQTHTTVGAEILQRVLDQTPDASYIKEAKLLAEYHHEKWNGQGYPHGAKGEEIPLSARIMAVADVFDALVSKRSYKEPFTFDKATKFIMKQSGIHFDPLVAEAFFDAKDRIRNVLECYED